MIEKVKPEDRFILCNHITEDGFCPVLNNYIDSACASENHCGNCKEFKNSKGGKGE